MKRIKISSKSANGTSFHGDLIRTSFNNIKKAFPEISDPYPADKSRYHITFELLDGEVVTLYDYKEYGIQEDTIVDFHIGGHSKMATAEAERILTSEIISYFETERLNEERVESFISSVNFLADEEC